MLSKRNIDRTEYETWAAAAFAVYWGQRISAAIVTADARRCLSRLPGLRSRAFAAAGAQRTAPRSPA